MAGRTRRFVDRVVGFTPLYIVIGLLVGAALVPPALSVYGGPDGTIAVVAVDGSIDGQQATRYQQAMTRARNQADAVVLIANSGGGSAAASETMYLQTKRTAAKMPVIVSVDGGALSGAYFTIAPADEIFVKPSSAVGSVGVLSLVPPDVEPNQLIATTGPNKLTGASSRGFYYQLETSQEGFLNAVFEGRGDRLELSRAEVGQASIYRGVTGVEHGLADAVGDRQRAIQEAADRAGLQDPEVVYVGPRGVERTFLLRGTYLASTAEEKELTGPDPFTRQSPGPPAFLMVPASTLAGTGGAVSANGEVVGVDADATTASGPSTNQSTAAGPARQVTPLEGGIAGAP